MSKIQRYILKNTVNRKTAIEALITNSLEGKTTLLSSSLTS